MRTSISDLLLSTMAWCGKQITVEPTGAKHHLRLRQGHIMAEGTIEEYRAYNVKKVAGSSHAEYDDIHIFQVLSCTIGVSDHVRDEDRDIVCPPRILRSFSGGKFTGDKLDEAAMFGDGLMKMQRIEAATIAYNIMASLLYNATLAGFGDIEAWPNRLSDVAGKRLAASVASTITKAMNRRTSQQEDGMSRTVSEKILSAVTYKLEHLMTDYITRAADKAVERAAIMVNSRPIVVNVGKLDKDGGE